MKKALTITATVAVASSLLFAGCSSDQSSSRDISEARSEVQAMAVETAVAADYSDGFYYNSAAAGAYAEDAIDYDYEYEVAEEYDEAAAAPGMTGNVNSNVSDPLSSGRMLIRRVSLTCDTLDFPNLSKNVEIRVNELGGYIENKSMYGTGNDGDLRTVSYTIRVPADKLDEVINMVGNSAVVTNTTESTEDVTLSYADTQAMLESLRVEQETLNQLLSQADSLETILILQNELTDVRYRIESCESTLRILENQSSYSTLNLTIREVLEETEVVEAHIKTYREKVADEFKDGLDDVKEFFEDAGLYIVGNLVPLAIRLVVLVIIIIVIVKAVKKHKRKNAARKASAAVNEAGTPANSQKPAAEDNKNSNT